MKDTYQKLFNLRKSLDLWETEIGIDRLSTKSKIIIEYLLSQRKLPISLNKIRRDNFVEKKMSIASFNRCINELIKSKKIKVYLDTNDRRSQIIDLF
jgi:predicted RNA-binding protein (virulence factor B family)